MALTFIKTAVHPFTPARHPPIHGSNFNLFNPNHLRLLPGQTVVVDFLLAVELPLGYHGEIKMKSKGEMRAPLASEKLRLHAAPLSKFPSPSLCGSSAI